MSKVIIKKNEEIIFQGNILDIPIKNEFIIQKSIEVFDDDDPCVIHKSYVVKQFVDDLLDKTNLKEKKEVNLTNYKDQLDYLDFEVKDTIIYLVGKK
ncbi:hypothetical protein KHQ81_11100 [Mycoplasmatota bacterium]|nr:hypothetical protein KHQ81_11100 [Mycoplasmatota bacterium]